MSLPPVRFEETPVPGSGAKRGWSVVLGLGLGLPAMAVGAPRIDYAAPDTCPDAATLTTAVERALGPAAPDPPVGLEVRIDDDARAARLVLRADDGRALGQRTVRAAAGDCDELVEAVALTAALALGPLAAITPPATPVEPTEPPVEPIESRADRSEAPADTPAPAPEPISTADPAEAAPPSSAFEAGGVVGLGGGLGLHPGASAVLSVGGRWRPGRWGAMVDVMASGAPAWFDGAVTGGRIRSGLIAVGVRACAAVAEFELCGGPAGGVEVHTGLDFAEAGDSTGPWLAVAGRLAYTVSAEAEDAVGWGVAVDGVAPLTRLDLTVDGRSVWRTPAVGGALGLFVGW